MKNSKRIPCRFCGWSTPAFRTTKKSKTTGPDAAFGRLASHVAIHHDEQMDRIRDFCADEKPE